MREKRMEMMNEIMRRFGFESRKTMIFCTIAEDETIDFSIVETKYNKLMEEFA